MKTYTQKTTTNKQNNQKSDDIIFRIEWVKRDERERDWKRERERAAWVWVCFWVRARAKYAKCICCSEKILNPLEEIKNKQKKHG